MNDSRKPLIPLLIAVIVGITAMPASALELDNVRVQSKLGQPLRASIEYSLAPNEALFASCVSMVSNRSLSGVPGAGNARLTVGDGFINIHGLRAIREPVLRMRLDIRCPYTATLSRDFTLFVSPAPTPELPAAAAGARPDASARRADRGPIAAGARYRVQPGDSISAIVIRVQNRRTDIRSSIARIVETNPAAFINNDPGRLMAGAVLQIPRLDSATVSVATAAVAERAPVLAPAAATTALEPEVHADAREFVPQAAGVSGPAQSAEPWQAAAETTDESAISGAYADDLVDDTEMLEPGDAMPMADLRPGDVILDRSLTTPGTSAEPVDVPVARIVEPAREPAPTNWLLWIIAPAVALVSAFLAFARRGSRTASQVSIQAEHRMRGDEAGDDATEQLEEFNPLDYDIGDDSPTEENLVLDADLVAGTGLEETGESEDIDVAQDFSFAMTTALDLELPEESRGNNLEQPETDIIPPLRAEISSILESEVLPEDDDYDMSVIVDATKMPQPEDVTERDLKAVPVDSADTRLTGEYTLNQEADFDMLERDYEDELTATQALNQEIDRAAAKIAARMEVAGESTSDTVERPLASVTELDVTGKFEEVADTDATMNAGLADDPDATINAELTGEISADDKTVEITADDKTVEMPGAANDDDDDTVEVPSADAN